METGTIFQKSISVWVRYSQYELRSSAAGETYIVPSQNAAAEVYDPLNAAEVMVMDAVNTGMLIINRDSDEKIRHAVLDFANRYGMLGLISVPPDSPHLPEIIHLPENGFVSDKLMRAKDYAALFFPFDEPGPEAALPGPKPDAADKAASISTMASEKPEAVKLSFRQSYAERYDWVARQFRDLAYSFCSCLLYYGEYGDIDDETRSICVSGTNGVFEAMAAPCFHLSLQDKPVVVWDFYSLSHILRMAFGLMLADDARPLRSCKHCSKVFLAGHPKAAFCDPKCKNKYNVYKFRDKQAGPPPDL